MRYHPLLSDFSAGELSERLETRTDSPDYNKGLRECINFIVLPQGGAYARPGFQYVTTCRESEAAVRLYIYDRIDDQIPLECGPGYLRVHDPAGAIDFDAPWVDGDLATMQSRQHQYERVFVNGMLKPHRLNWNPDSGWTFEPYTFLQIPQHNFNDSLSPPSTSQVQQLTLTGTWISGDSFGLEVLSDTTQPIFWTNDDEQLAGTIQRELENILLSPEAGINGSVTVTVSAAQTFDISYDDDLSGLTAAIAVVDVQGSGNAAVAITQPGTGTFTEDAWSDARGWPRAVSFYQQRLVMASTLFLPQTVWGSRTASFADFNVGPEPSDAIIHRVDSEDLTAIKWIANKREMAFGTGRGDFVQLARPWEPGNFDYARMNSLKAAQEMSVEIGSVTAYLQAGGQKLRFLAFEERPSATYQSIDATIRAEHITGRGVAQLAYAEKPDSVLWCVRTDGALIGMTYVRQADVVAWHKHATRGRFISVAVRENGPYDEVWAVVRRNGSQYIEYMPFTSQNFESDDVDSSGDFTTVTQYEFPPFADSSVTRDGSSGVITGLDHLNGNTVEIVRDGIYDGTDVVQNGQITLKEPGQRVLIGLPYPARMTTFPQQESPSGTGLGTKRRFAKCFARLIASAFPLINGTRERDRSQSTPLGTPEPLYTGETRTFQWGYEAEGKVEIVRDLPYPCHVTGIYGIAAQHGG